MTSARKEDYLRTKERIFEKILHQSEIPQAQQTSLTYDREEIPFLKSSEGRKCQMEKEVPGINPEEAYLEAQKMVEEGKEEEAILVLEALLRSAPDHALAHNDLGVLYFKKGEKEGALLHLQKAFELDPHHPDILHNLSAFHAEPVSIPGGELDVSIIIPVFNQVEYTRRCLEKIYQVGSPQYRFEVLVVDNGSTDGTGSFLQQACIRFPNLSYVQNAETLGFAKACNQGARRSKGKYLIFLENDTEPLPGWLEAGIDRIRRDEEIGIVGAKLLYPDRSVQHCGIEFKRNAHPDYALWPLHRFRYVHSEDPKVNHPEEVQAVTGACLFITRSLFDEVGGISEEYGMYFEDIDLCMKVRQKGKKVFYEPGCVLIHHEGKLSLNQATNDAFNVKTSTLFYQKWSDEIVKLDMERLVAKRKGKYIHFCSEILPLPENGNFPATNLKNLLIHLAKIFESIGPFYAHFGGAGDALLLLASFYDEEPEQTVVSIANSSEMMESFFDAFPRLKQIYFIPFPKNYQNHLLLREIFRKLKNFKGMGVTPSPDLDYFKEWSGVSDIFQKYGIVRRPQWVEQFRTGKQLPYQVTLAPRGSLKGMVGSKQNLIPPQDWESLIHFLNERDIHPIILGTPEEAFQYPAIGHCLDRRSYCFEEQMKLIANSDLFIGADSWGKTFSALAGVKTFVFHSIRGEDLKGWKDPADYIFLDPWEEITVVKDVEEFKRTFDSLFGHDKKGNTLTSLPTRPCSSSHRFNGHYYIQRTEGLGDVLMALPSARALKSSHPEGKVCFITGRRYRKLVEANPYVDRVMVAGEGDRHECTTGKFWDLNPARFGTGEIHEVDAFLREIGIEIPDSMKEITLKVPKGIHKKVDQLLRKNGLHLQQRGRKTILIHPAKGDLNRTWPSLHWEKLCEMFIKKGHRVILVGNNTSDPRRGVSRVRAKGVIEFVDQLTPLEFVSLCQRADLLVSTDSGPIQLAGASNIAIVGIYTVIPGRCRLPYRHGSPMWRATPVEPDLPCAGCYRYLHDNKYFAPVDKAIHEGSLTPDKLFSEWCIQEEKYVCLLRQITPERVFETCEGMLR